MPRIRSERPAFDLHYPEYAPGAPARQEPVGGGRAAEIDRD
jgi:hypothetical protein